MALMQWNRVDRLIVTCWLVSLTTGVDRVLSVQTQFGTQLVVTAQPFELQGTCAGGSPFCVGSTCYGTACVTPGANCLIGCASSPCGCSWTNAGTPCRSAAQCTGSNPLLSSGGLTNLIPGSSQFCQITSINQTLFGGKSFGPITIALKDPSFKTVTTASGIPVSVQLLGCQSRCDLVGQTVKMMSYGEAVFDSLTILQVGDSYSLRFQIEQTCSIASCIPHGILATSIAVFKVIPGQLSYLSIDVFPQQAIANSDFNPSPMVSTRDAGGNIIPLRMQITVSKGARGDGVAVFSRDGLNFRFSEQGVAVFSRIFVSIISIYDIVFNTSIGNVSFTATYSGLIVTGSERYLTISNNFPTSNTYTSLVPFQVQPSIVVTDERGTVVESSELFVEASALDGTSQSIQALTGSSRMQFVKGVLRFTDLSIGGAGVGYKVRFQAGLLSVTTATTFDVIPGEAATLEVFRQPAPNWTAGDFAYPNPRIRVVDHYSNVIVQSVIVATRIRPVDSIAGSLNASVFSSNISQAQYADQGFLEIANLHVEVAGTYVLEFMLGNLSNLSSSFVVFPAAIFKLFIARQPISGVIGSALQPPPLVELHDKFGNMITNGVGELSCSAILQSNPTGATLMCAGSFPCLERFVNGRAQFTSISLNNAGKGYQLLFTVQTPTANASMNQLVAITELFDISGLVSSALVTLPTSSIQCGEAFRAVVTLKDLYGNTVRASQDGVAVELLSLSDGRLLSVQGTTIVLARDGIADFTNLVVGNIGESFQFIFSCNVSKINIRSQNVAVVFGSANSIQILVSPTMSRVDNELTMSMTVVDVCASTVLSFNSNVSYSLVDDNQSSTLLGTTPLTSGHVMLMLNLSVVGQSLTIASYANSFNISGVSNKFALSFGAIASLRVERLASSAVVLRQLTPAATLTARDAGGNLVMDFDGVILARKLSGNSADSNLVGVTETAAAKGWVMFHDLQVTLADSDFRIEFLYWNLSSSSTVRSFSPPIIVTGDVAELRLVSIAENAAGGAPFANQPALAVFDQSGSPVLSYSGNALVQVNDTIADPLAGTTSVTFHAGKATFTDLTLSLASNSRVLLFTTGSLSVKQLLAVQQGSPVALLVAQQPVDTFGFKTFQQPVAVKVVDKGLNAVTSIFSCQLWLTNGNAALLSGTLSKLTTSGVASFTNVRIDAIGFGFALNFSCSSQDGTISLYNVSSFFRLYGSAVALSLYRFPAGAITGVSLTPAVELRLLDETYNYIPLAETFSCSAKVLGSVVFDNGVLTATGANGIAVFTDLKVSYPANDQISGMQLLFECQFLSTCLQVVSPFFSITYTISTLSVLSPLVYEQVMVGEIFSPSPLVQALDSLGRVVSGASSAVKVSLLFQDSMIAGLQGNLSTQLNAGISNFTDLYLSTIGGPYRLKFEVPTITAVPFVYVDILNVTNGPPQSLQIVTQPQQVPAHQEFSVQPCVRVNDKYNNLAVYSDVQVSVVLIASNTTSSAILRGQTNVKADKGYATFTDLQIQNANVDEIFFLRFTLHSNSTSSSSLASLNSDAVKVLFGSVHAISIIQSFPPAIVSAQAQMLLFRASDIANNSLTRPCNLTITFVSLSADLTSKNKSYTVNDLNPSSSVFNVSTTVNEVGRYLLFLSINNVVSPPSQFLVLQGQPCCLRLLSQPRDTMIGKTIIPHPQIIAVDDGGNSLIRTGMLVSVSVSHDVLSAQLDGNTSVIMDDDIAGFTDLSVNLAGDGFLLVFQAESLKPALSSSFRATGTVSGLDIQMPLGDRVVGAAWSGQPQVFFSDNSKSRIACNCVRGVVVVSLHVDGRILSDLEGNKQFDVTNDFVLFTDLSVKLASSKFSLKFEFTPVGYGAPIVNFSPAFEVMSGRASKLEVVIQMDSSLRGVAPGRQPAVVVLDSFRNVVSSFVGTADVRLSQATEDKGSLHGRQTAPFVNGTATFTDLSITPISGSSAYFVLLFSSSGFSVLSAPVDIVSGPIAAINSTVVTYGSILQMHGLLQPQPEIAAVDTSGGIVTDFDGDQCGSSGCNISVAIRGGSSPSPLEGQTSVKAQAGVARFTDLRLSVSGSYQLVFSAQALWGSTVFSTVQSNVEVSSIAGLQLEVSPALAVNGQALRTQPIVRVLSLSSNTLLASRHVVTARLISSSSCKGIGSASNLEMSVTAQQGRAVFSDISIFAEAGFCSLQFLISLGDNGSAPFVSVDSQPIYVMQNSPSLTLQTHLSSESAGLPFQQQPQLVAQQLDGSALTGNGFVDVRLIDGSGRYSSLKGNTNMLFYSNTLTFTNLAVDRVGQRYRLLFTYMDLYALSDPFEVVNGSIASLFLLQPPTHVHVGVTFTQPVSACARDAGGNDAIIQPSDSFAASLVYLILASLQGSTQTIQESSCVIFTSLTVDTPAKGYRLKITETTSNVFVLSDKFDVHADMAQLTLNFFPVKQFAAGEVLDPRPVVLLTDNYGVRAWTSHPNISLTLQILQNGEKKSLAPSNFDGGSQTCDKGLCSFPSTSIFLASDSLILSFAAGSSSVSSPLFSVTAGALTSLSFVQEPAGIQFFGVFLLPHPIVEARDKFSNLIHVPYNVSACFQLVNQTADTNVSLCHSDSFFSKLCSFGVCKFDNLYLKLSPARGGLAAVLHFHTDAMHAASASLTSGLLSFRQSSPRLVVTQSPFRCRTATPCSQGLVVELQDAGGYQFNNLQPGFSFLPVRVQIASSSTNASVLRLNGVQCPCLVPLNKGKAVFDKISFDRAAVFYSLQLSLDALGLDAIFSDAISVFGPVVRMELHSSLRQQVALTETIEFSLHLSDVNTLSVPGVDVLMKTVAIGASDQKTCVFALEPLTSLEISESSNESGMVEFKNVSFTRFYGCRLKVCFEVTDKTLVIDRLKQSNSVCSIVFDVIHDSPTSLLLSPTASQWTSDQMPLAPFVVSARDRFNHSTIFSTAWVNLSVSHVQTSEIQNFSHQLLAGAAAFALNLPQAGTYLLDFSLYPFGNEGAKMISVTITILPGGLDHLSVVQQPRDCFVMQAFDEPAIVIAADRANNPILDLQINITVFKYSGQNARSVLQDLLSVPLVSGQAKFGSLRFNDSDSSVILRFSTDSGCRRSVLSSSFAVSGPPAQVAPIAQSTTAVASLALAIQPKLRVSDAGGQTCSAFVGYACANLTDQTLLKGNTTATFRQGVAEFTDLSLRQVGFQELSFKVYQVPYPLSSINCLLRTNLTVVTSLTITVGDAAEIRFDTQKLFDLAQLTSGINPSVYPAVQMFDAGGNIIAQKGNYGIQVSLMAVEMNVSKLSMKTTDSSLKTLGASIITSNFVDNKFDCNGFVIQGTGFDVYMKLALVRSDINPNVFVSLPSIQPLYTNTFNVLIGEMNELIVLQQPAGCMLNFACKQVPVVAIRDMGGNIIATEYSLVSSC
eukprot:750942-Hanusia_phi.AAC.8